MKCFMESGGSEAESKLKSFFEKGKFSFSLTTKSMIQFIHFDIEINITVFLWKYPPWKDPLQSGKTEILGKAIQ